MAKAMTLEDKILDVLDVLRPFLLRDGGDVEFMGVDENGIVDLKMMGACGSCPSSVITLKSGIENALKEDIEEVNGVRQVY